MSHLWRRLLIVASVVVRSKAQDTSDAVIINAGVCGPVAKIDNADDCQDAAEALGIGWGYSAFFGFSYPSGCFQFYPGAFVFFNTYPGISSRDCSSFPCVCKNELVPSPAPTFALELSDVVTVDTGMCDAPVTTSGHCEQGASLLGLPYGYAGNWGSYRPPGCFYYPSDSGSVYSGYVFFNTYTSSQYACSSTRSCLCLECFDWTVQLRDSGADGEKIVDIFLKEHAPCKKNKTSTHTHTCPPVYFPSFFHFPSFQDGTATLFSASARLRTP